MRLAVRVTPKSSASRIEGLVATVDGVALQVRLAAPPADGAANKALLLLLADMLELRRSDVILRAGQASRLKSVFLRGNPDDLVGRLQRLIGQ